MLVLAVIALGAVAMLMHDGYNGDGRLLTPANAVEAAKAVANEIQTDGRAVGEVLMANSVLFRIRTAAGGLSPYERAQKVAGRLDVLLADSIQAKDITTGVVNGMNVVLAGEEVVVTADKAHADLNGTTGPALAAQWANNLRVALGGEPVTATAAATAPPPVPTATKIVPIISVGSGVRIGGAQVTGPKEFVEQVKAVAQIEGDFRDVVRVRILVPVSTEDIVQKISRVPQTSVTALVDLKI
jgi:hypothetical protein